MELHTDSVSRGHDTQDDTARFEMRHRVGGTLVRVDGSWGVAVRLLDGEFSALSEYIVRVAGHFQEGYGYSYRQHSQQGSLACVLESDHGDIHLGCPSGCG